MIVTKKHKLYVRDHKGVLRNLYKTAPGAYLEVILAFMEGDSSQQYSQFNKDAKIREDYKPVPVSIDVLYKDEFKKLLREVHGVDSDRTSIVVSYNGSWQPLALISLEEVKEAPQPTVPTTDSTVFDKVEAVALMMQGNRMTHENFSDNEWLTMEGTKYLFEDGVICSPELFWADRQGSGWETGWTIYKAKPQKTKGPVKGEPSTLVAIISKDIDSFNKWAKDKGLYISNLCAYSESKSFKYVPVHAMEDTTGKRFDYFEVIEDWEGAFDLIKIIETRLKKD